MIRFFPHTQVVIRGNGESEGVRRAKEIRSRIRDLLLSIHRRRPEPTAAVAAALASAAAVTPAVRCDGAKTIIRQVFVNLRTWRNNSNSFAIITSALPAPQRLLGQSSKPAAG